MELGFFARLALAWRILFDAVFASKVKALDAPKALDATPALQLLGLLQREGRFVDFLQEDISGASDSDVGAAARVVHDGCRKGLKDYIGFTPVRLEAEGASVTIEPGFDKARTRLTGKVSGQGPFKGKLAHHGWLVEGITLPALSAGHDPKVIAPAEVEV